MFRSTATAKEWPKLFHAALWADRVTTKRTTGFTPYYLIYGRDAVLPIELTYETWMTIPNLQETMTTEDLLKHRIEQIQYRYQNMKIATQKLIESRQANKKYWDKKRKIRRRPLEQGDIVLLHNTKLLTQQTGKDENKWFGPYRITKANTNGSYYLEELDGTLLKKAVAGDRLKIFRRRDQTKAIVDDDIKSENDTQDDVEETTPDDEEM